MEMWLAPSTCVPRVISSQQCQWHQNSKPQGEEEKRDGAWCQYCHFHRGWNSALWLVKRQFQERKKPLIMKLISNLWSLLRLFFTYLKPCNWPQFFSRIGVETPMPVRSIPLDSGNMNPIATTAIPVIVAQNASEIWVWNTSPTINSHPRAPLCQWSYHFLVKLFTHCHKSPHTVLKRTTNRIPARNKIAMRKFNIEKQCTRTHSIFIYASHPLSLLCSIALRL